MKKISEYTVGIFLVFALFSTAVAGINDGLVAYYPLDGNANDATLNGNDGNENGGVTYTDGVMGQAALFDGIDDSVTLMSYHERSNQETYTAWVQLDPANISPNANMYFLNLGNDQTAGSLRFLVHSNPSLYANNEVRFKIHLRGDNQESNFLVDNSQLSTNWVFYAYTRNENQHKFFRNGDLIDSATFTILSYAAQFELAVNTPRINDFPFWAKGSLDDVRVYNRALSDAEIKELFVETSPYADLNKGLVAYYPFNGNANDVSGFGNDGTAHGNVDFTANGRNGEPNSGIYIGDYSSYIRIPSAPIFDVQTYTVAAWIQKYQGSLSANGGVFCYGDDNVSHYGIKANNNRIAHENNYRKFYEYEGNYQIYNTDVLQDQKFHHIVITYDGAYKIIWIDGNLVSRVEFTGPINYSTQEDIIVGNDLPGGDEPLEGVIDEICVYNRALSEEEIRILYGFPADQDVIILRGSVVEKDSLGNPISPLENAFVSLTGPETLVTNTDDVGAFEFTCLIPGEYVLDVSKPGYYPVSRNVTVGSSGIRSEIVYLVAEKDSEPTAFDFQTLNGKHFIEGVPNDLSFAIKVAWNGTPGSVNFNVSEELVPGYITDLGGGLAQVELTIAAPSKIDECSELKVEIVNGEGYRTLVNTGVYFSPSPGILDSWYSNNIWWTPSGPYLSYSESFSQNFELPFPSEDIKFELSLGGGQSLKYDLLAASFGGSKNISGGLGFSIQVPSTVYEVFGGGGASLSGGLDITFVGCEMARIRPSWTFSLNRESGIGAPAIALLDLVVPGLGSSLSEVPGLNSLKLRLSQIFGGSISGVYENYENHNCWFGATGISGGLSIGLKGEAALELTKKLKCGVYVGGDTIVNIGICPEIDFESITGRIYVGAFAEYYGFKIDHEEDGEICWDFNKSLKISGSSASNDFSLTDSQWTPVGRSLLRWGNTNRLSSDGTPLGLSKSSSRQSTASKEEKLIENVISLTSPSILADIGKIQILFAFHDTDKPWYAATDIANVQQDETGTWFIEHVTEDLVAEYNPTISNWDIETNWAAWTRVEGDVSQAESPEDIFPHLEIVGCSQNTVSGTWGTPVQLTANQVVDRDPTILVYGANQGIAWIQNQAVSILGDSNSGDSLLLSVWNGSDFDTPFTLWNGQKGIVEYSFSGDSTGEGYIVFVVDEDGDTETVEDRELYLSETINGVWQSAIRLTDDSVEDTLPVLIEVNGYAMCIWKKDAALLYTFLNDWIPKDVFTKYTEANEAPSLTGLSLQGGAAVAYTVQTEEGIDIFAAFYDYNLDQWSLPRQLTADEHAESSLSLGYDGEQLVMAYLKTQTERVSKEIEINGQIETIENVPQPGRTDLYLLKHQLGYDLAVSEESIAFTPSNPVPGETATINAVIENRGDKAVETFTVEFYEGDPNASGVLIEQLHVDETLIAGDSKNVGVSWSSPGVIAPLTVFIVVDPLLEIDDRDRSNNAASKGTFFPDLTPNSVTSHTLSQSTLALSAKIFNEGVVPNGYCYLSWRANAPDGPEIGNNIVGSIEPGAVHDVVFNWDVEEPYAPGGFLTVYAIVDPGNIILESDETNNSGGAIVKVPIYADSDSIDDEWEFQHFGILMTAHEYSDYDKDGYSDTQEYQNWLDGINDPDGASFDPKVQNSLGGVGYDPSTVVYVSSSGNCEEDEICYLLIQSGIDHKANVLKVRVAQGNYAEDLVQLFRPGVFCVLSGGFNSEFNEQEDFSNIEGTLEIAGGTLCVRNIAIVGP